MKVADLYAALGIKADQRQFKAAQQEVRSFGKLIARDLAAAGKSLGRGVGGMVGKVTGGLKNFAGGILPIAGLAAAGAAVTGVVTDVVAFDKALGMLDIASDGAIGSQEEFRKKILAVSKETGVAKEQLMAGAASFVALTGDGKGAADALLVFARVAKATGADMADVAGAGAAMVQQMKIDPKDLEAAFSIVHKSSKAGAIELKQMADELAGLSSGFKEFKGGEGMEGMAELSSAFQLAAKNFGGNAAETATGLEALIRSLGSKQSVEKLRKAGIDPLVKNMKTGNMEFRNFMDIIMEIADSPLAKDPTLLVDALGREEAVKTFKALRDNRDVWVDMKRASMGARDIAKDYEKTQLQASAKIEKAWNSFKVRIAEALTPERVMKFAGALEKVAVAGIGLIDWIDDFATRFDERIVQPMKNLADTLMEPFKRFDRFMRDKFGSGPGESPGKISRLKPGELDSFEGGGTGTIHARGVSRAEAMREGFIAGAEWQPPIITREGAKASASTEDHRSFSAEVNIYTQPGGAVPDAFDIKEQLKRMWDGEMRRAGR